MHHKTIGIVELGCIGQAVARRAQGFSMRVLYTGPRPRPEADPLRAAYCPLETLLAESDFVVLLAPLRPETHHLIGQTELTRMKPDAILINAGRGALVDEAALVDVLAGERIWGAGLDVYEREPLPPDHPLARRARVVTLPHLGSATAETRRAMARLATENLAAALTGRPMRHPVRISAPGLPAAPGRLWREVIGVWPFPQAKAKPKRHLFGGVNCCPICLTNRDNRCSCRPNPACAGCPWFPLPLRRRS